MSIKSLLTTAAMAGVAGLLLASAPARADVVQYDLTVGNTALTGYPTPFGSVSVTYVDSTHLTAVFTAADPAGQYSYAFGAEAAVGLNLRGGTASDVTQTASVPVGNPSSFTIESGGVSTFGNFNTNLHFHDGNGDAVTSITLAITAAAGTTWSSAANALLANASGNVVEGHIFVRGTTDPTGAACSTGVCTTGFSTGTLHQNEPPPAVPELSTWGMMLLGFFGLGIMAYRRRGSTLEFRAA